MHKKKNDANFCSCCGIKMKKIREELEKLPFNNNSRTWKNHTQFCTNGDNIHNSGEWDFCPECGEELEDEDFKSINESRPWGDTHANEMICTGFHCKCGYEEKF